MTIKNKVKNYAQVEKKALRNFGLIMAAMIGLIFGIIIPLIFGKSWPILPWPISSIFILLALICPKILIIIYIPWMLFGEILGYINSKIILAIVFYLLFTPIAFIMKLLGKDPMRRKIEKHRTSYRINVNNNNNLIKNMENPY